MNQNNSMTHNTRERIEEIVEKFDVMMHTGYHGDIKQWLRTTLHQELQKARQDWLREEIVRLEGMKNTVSALDLEGNDIGELQKEAFNHALQTIIDRYHSELDQDNQLLNKVISEWDTQAKNLMNGLDQNTK